MRLPNASPSAIQSLLAEGQAEARPWHRIGLALDEIEKTQAWRESASTFTEWIQKTAPMLGLKESSLWRYMRSCRIYANLRKEMAAKGHKLPEPEFLPPQTGAESLELFEKVRRVAPERVTDPLAFGLVRGEVTRAQLRTIWLDYRPALAGRTARGYGLGSAPRVDRRDPDAAKSLGEAEALLALRGDRAWTGTADPDIYTVFSHVGLSLRRSARGGGRRELDAVVAVRAGEGTDLVFHAFEIRRSPVGEECNAWFHEVASYVDYAWIAVVGPIETDTVTSVPAGLGVAEIRPGQIRVRRPPERVAGGSRLSGELAKQLLISELRR